MRMHKSDTNALHKRRNEGTEYRFGLNRQLLKFGESEGAKLANMFVSTFPPGGGNPFLHLHRSYEEMFYVLEGEIQYQLGQDKILGIAGDGVFVPAGVPHKFENIGFGQATHLVIVSPCAAMRMIEELGRTGFDPASQAEVLERYDSVLLNE